MQHRTRLFLETGSIVLLIWAAAWWSIHGLISAHIERSQADQIKSTIHSLHDSQTAEFDRMRQIGNVIIHNPRLQEIIDDRGLEISTDDLTNLQNLLDTFAKETDIALLGVLDHRGSLIAQNSRSPWKTDVAMQKYLVESDQAVPMIHTLLRPKTNPQDGYWIFRGQLYQVVGIPLPASKDAGQPEGTLIIAKNIAPRLAEVLAQNHNCQVTYLSPNLVLASTLKADQAFSVMGLFDSNELPLAEQFNLPIEDVNYLSYLQPIEDAPSHSCIGAVLIQTSQTPAEMLQRKLSLALLLIMSCGLVAVGCASAFAGRRINRPVQQLVAAMRTAAAGDFNFSIRAAGHNELAQLTTAFNNMVEQLRHQQMVRSTANELASLRLRLSELEKSAEAWTVRNADHSLAELRREIQECAEEIDRSRTAEPHNVK
jgi:HAMP domain-containing protein